jgi:hypothetical protein
MTTATNPINNTEDIIDSRDVIARIEYLEAEHDDEQCGPDLDTCVDIEEHQDELPALKALASDAGGYMPDWPYGVGLIRDSYFEDHARELAEEMAGGIEREMVNRWPFTCIDWEQAADELKQDYTEVIFDGVSYWGR